MLLRNGWKSLMVVLVLVGLVGAPALAAGLTKNSVKSKHIKDGQVLTQDIGDGQVWTEDIGDGEVRTEDIAGGQVTEVKLAAFVDRSQEISVPAGEARHISSTCEAGERAVGVSTDWGETITGGGSSGPIVIVKNAVANNLVTAQFATTPTRASATGRNNSSSAFTFTVTAKCMG